MAVCETHITFTLTIKTEKFSTVKETKNSTKATFVRSTGHARKGNMPQNEKCNIQHQCRNRKMWKTIGENFRQNNLAKRKNKRSLDKIYFLRFFFEPEKT